MKQPLLEIVQDILDVLEFDPVNDLADTVESMQVAKELQTAYFFLMTQRDRPHLCMLGSLDGVGDLNNPTYMRIPSNVSKVKWVRYNNKECFYKEPEEFQDMLNQRLLNAHPDVNTKGFLTKQDPSYWTSYDDTIMVFDAYDSLISNTLVQSKSVAYCVQIPTFELENTHYANMPARMYPGWIADAKSSCFINLKQTANAKEENRSKLGRTIMQSESRRNEKGNHRFNRKVNYGR